LDIVLLAVTVVVGAIIIIAVAATDVAVYKALKVLQPYLVRAL
jgi:hypothetical protein